MSTLANTTMHRAAQAACQLPARAGLGLKPEYFRGLLEDHADIGFLEIHAENYMVEGGPFHHYLGLLHEKYALSIHGVGLSIGAETPLDGDHLQRLKTLFARHPPQAFSEHLAWSSHGPLFLNDLLPLAYDRPTLDRVCVHVDQVQGTLGRPLLLENPATYLEFKASTLDETDFISEIVQRTGCGLLLDVNNVYVSCINHGRDPLAYLSALPLHAVEQVHLAGFSEDTDGMGQRLLIDSHSAPIDDAVWALYRQLLQRIGPVPTLIERDNDLPPLPQLLAEARLAEELILACKVQP
ncbi:MAG: MNIO family bufferin maturase [Pseudomonas sp.]